MLLRPFQPSTHGPGPTYPSVGEQDTDADGADSRAEEDIRTDSPGNDYIQTHVSLTINLPNGFVPASKSRTPAQPRPSYGTNNGLQDAPPLTADDVEIVRSPNDSLPHSPQSKSLADINNHQDELAISTSSCNIVRNISDLTSIACNLGKLSPSTTALFLCDMQGLPSHNLT
jgi:hypothetical protein